MKRAITKRVFAALMVFLLAVTLFPNTFPAYASVTPQGSAVITPTGTMNGDWITANARLKFAVNSNVAFKYRLTDRNADRLLASGTCDTSSENVYSYSDTIDFTETTPGVQHVTLYISYYESYIDEESGD